MTQEPTAPQNAVVKAEEPRALVVLKRELEAREQDLLTVLPKGMDVRRFVRVSLMALTKNATLLECAPGSVIRSIVEAAELGLEPTGASGGAHLVPFKDHGVMKAQMILDYRGTQHLVRDGGGGEVKAVLVYEGDQFAVYEGTNPRIEHIPSYETNDPAKITYCYAYPLDHPEKFEVMTRKQLDAVRARSKAANNGPWVTDYGQMCRKTTIKRLANYLDLIPQFRQALEEDTKREFEAPASTPVNSGTASIRAALAAKVGAVLPPPPDPQPTEPDESIIEGVAVPVEAAIEQQAAPTEEAPVVEQPPVAEQDTEQEAFALANEAIAFSRSMQPRERRPRR